MHNEYTAIPAGDLATEIFVSYAGRSGVVITNSGSVPVVIDTDEQMHADTGFRLEPGQWVTLPARDGDIDLARNRVWALAPDGPGQICSAVWR